VSTQGATEQDWTLRAAIYRHFVDHARAPEPEEMATKIGLSLDESQSAYQRLHDAHAFFLEPGTTSIRMLNPFSAVETPFQVEVGDNKYYANCAWDMLGIPGMLGRDALIHARLEADRMPVELAVRDGMSRPDHDYVVNFSVPFRDWYADLIHT